MKLILSLCADVNVQNCQERILGKSINDLCIVKKWRYTYGVVLHVLELLGHISLKINTVETVTVNKERYVEMI